MNNKNRNDTNKSVIHWFINEKKIINIHWWNANRKLMPTQLIPVANINVTTMKDVLLCGNKVLKSIYRFTEVFRKLSLNLMSLVHIILNVV